MTSSGPAARRPSLRQRVTATLWVVSVVFVAGAVLATISLVALFDVREELVDRLDPATTATAELRAAVLDQETGLRGYVLTRDPAFLAPYDDGREDAARLLGELEEWLGPARTSTDDLPVIRQRLAFWQDSVAEPLIDFVDDGGPGVTEEALVAGREAFDDVRAAIDDLAGRIAEDREAVRQELADASRNLTLTLMGLGALLITLVAIVRSGLRRLVLDPLSVTVDDARRIAEGELDHEASTQGLAELAAVGEALERMRTSLVARIREVEAREADLERSNAELEQFAYVASHDLQEPLRKVASFCQLLQRRYAGQLDEKADSYIEFAVDGATRMQDLINDLLQFSRVGRTTERFVDLDGDDVLDAALANLSTALHDAGATVERSPMPPMVGDRSLLVALFQNLVGNALKFRSPEPPVVRIDAAERDGVVEVTVSDNGIGIPPEYRDRVFVIFQRLHGRSEYEGTGIGLALCRKIVEFHGGRIEVVDRDGPGATFRFTLDPSRAGPDAVGRPRDPGERRALVGQGEEQR